jgi:hypothetical protein
VENNNGKTNRTIVLIQVLTRAIIAVIIVLAGVLFIATNKALDPSLADKAIVLVGLLVGVDAIAHYLKK